MQTVPSAAAAADRTTGPDPTRNSGTGRADGGTGDRERRRSLVALLVLAVLLAVPLVVSVAVLWEPRWYPSVDLAQTELRVRDVWTAHPPLTGLGGRIGVYGADQGSHPGPLSFWSLSIFYRLFGMTSAALQAAAADLNILAMALALWLARRRGGMGLLWASPPC